MLNGGVHGFISIASDEGKVFSHGMESATIEDNLLLLEEDVGRTDTAMNNIILV